MENYFVLLEVPVKTGEAGNFWDWTRQTLIEGSAKVISSRVDTGICEEFKNYLKQINHFTTFVLLQTVLSPADFVSGNSLCAVLASAINLNGKTEVLDQTVDFRVLAQA